MNFPGHSVNRFSPAHHRGQQLCSKRRTFAGHRRQAVSDREGNFGFKQQSAYGYPNTSDEITVPTTTIDSLSAMLDLPRADLIKIDVEGLVVANNRGRLLNSVEAEPRGQPNPARIRAASST